MRPLLEALAVLAAERHSVRFFLPPGGTVPTVIRRIVEAIKANPARALGYALAAAILAASAITGTPLAVIIGEVAGFVAAIERIRAVVAPMSKVLVHVDDLAADDEGLPPSVRAEG